jgi:SOS-response transcriptional repressor LexA
MHLAQTLGIVQDGDIIIVHNEAQKTLGEIAAARMRPGVALSFARGCTEL